MTDTAAQVRAENGSDISITFQQSLLGLTQETGETRAAVSVSGLQITIRAASDDAAAAQRLQHHEGQTSLVIATMGNRRLYEAALRAEGQAAVTANDGEITITLPPRFSDGALRRLALTGGSVVIAFCLGIGLGTTVIDQHPVGSKPMTQAQAQALVKGASHGKAKVVKVFPGPGGLTGVVIQGGRQKTIGWGIDAGKPLLAIGELFNGDGQELTTPADRQHHVRPLRMSYAKPRKSSLATQPAGIKQAPHPQQRPRMEAMKPAALYKAIQHHGYLVPNEPGLTHAAHTIYVFVDANCPFCHLTYEAAQQEATRLKRAGVQIDYLPAAVLKASSIGKAAAILKGGAHALQRNEAKFNVGNESGAIKPIKSKHFIAQVRANTVLLDRDGKTGAVPTVVWKGVHGKVHIELGALNSKQIAQIAGQWSSKTGKSTGRSQ